MKRLLNKIYKTKEPGEFKYFLRREVDRKDKITLTQHKHLLDVMIKALTEDCKPKAIASVIRI